MIALTLREYKAAIKLIPKYLGIAFNTFHNYRKIDIGDPQDIPYEKVIALEKLFGMQAGGLTNRVLHYKTLKELINNPTEIPLG